jgi:hypothetical protein
MFGELLTLPRVQNRSFTQVTVIDELSSNFTGKK